MFKKVVVENHYVLVNWPDYRPFYEKGGINGFQNVATYDSDTDDFSFRWVEGDRWEYERIYADVKNKCSYYKVVNDSGQLDENYTLKNNDKGYLTTGLEFITYSCPESTYSGKLGFATSPLGYAYIKHFAKRRTMEELQEELKRLLQEHKRAQESFDDNKISFQKLVDVGFRLYQLQREIANLRAETRQ